ncbi:hypothetical protein [Roseibacillus ishigakijimensis]|uniref:Verru_Chthon cassette protein A n=1 Tax=Roseibacillus ishigakijimensis TaxID=454146 RepID=A0A934RRW3_9BACT|nr:hypothetical protein [Roseibacillus ishigakijimensis]MBK1833115.1 hypothetical protein [Roseibacillus ishigakijimensis]
MKIGNYRGTRNEEHGFAMVVTVTMLVLLSMLAIGVLQLSMVQIRTTSESRSLQAARANARLALSLALGELQETMGPDQRVSAPSSLLDRRPDTEEVEGVEHPHWVSVWRTTLEDGMPVIQRDAQDGGLKDMRSVYGWDAEDDRLSVLVSGNESDTNYVPEDREDGTEMMTLVGRGTLGADALSDGLVKAPVVPLSDPNLKKDAQGSDKPNGAYAWWVGDLGAKANIGTVDPYEDLANPVNQMRRLQLAQDASFSGAENGDEISNEVRAKLITDQQLELLDGMDNYEVGQYFHDFTTQSRSVLADAREGGLKQDLTAYFISPGNIASLDESDSAYLGLNDEDNVIGPRNQMEAALTFDGGQAERLKNISPKFELMREWVTRGNRYNLGDIEVAAESGQTEANQNFGGHGGHNHFPVKFRNRTENDIAPVLVEGSTYYNISTFDTGQQGFKKWGLRAHIYPRVALWNPYNFPLEVPPSMINLFINGGKVAEVSFDPPLQLEIRTIQGMHRIDLAQMRYRMNWGSLQNENGGDGSGWRRGTMYFRLGGVTIEPGETVLFSPANNQPYNEHNLAANYLSPNVPPDAKRSFYMDEFTSKDDRFDALFQLEEDPVANKPPGVFYDNFIPAQPYEWREYVSVKPSGDVQAARYTQADDYYMYWKPIEGRAQGEISLSDFSNLPHGQFVSCAFQYGDEDELPVSWSDRNTVLMPISGNNGVVEVLPDRRTRDGFRLRWFDEHASNRRWGKLANTPHLESAAIANWNLRASYSFRSPYENVNDEAPHFFGIYTRDLFDDRVSWHSMNPGYRDGKSISDPFNPPSENVARRILFDAPRRQAGVQSLGALQHVKFSELIWHPTYALGNSLIDPRMPIDRTEPRLDSVLNSRQGGWNKDSIGHSTDGRSDSNGGGVSNEENWAHAARRMLADAAFENTLIFDLSYELNHSLWDRYFLSTGDRGDKRDFATSPDLNPLPNGRLRLHKTSKEDPLDHLLDYHRAASVLVSDGGFNVNSTSVEAWEAILLSTVDTEQGGQVSFPRILNTPLDGYDGGEADSQAAWTATRKLSRTEVRRLAEEIVYQVKTRGPFLSMSDFVNRRLVDGPEGLKGCLQAAIDRSGINGDFQAVYPLDNSRSLPSFTHSDHIKEPTRIEQTHKPETTAWGALGFLTQADMLQTLGHNLFVRSDTFVVRAYGESRSASGKVQARAWCEAVVQRSPQPVRADRFGLNPEKDDGLPDFGRRFEVRSFRWLTPEEV